MKALILMFSLLTFGSSSVWADNLFPYIEMPVSSNNLLTFSSQGIQFKACDNCTITRLTPSADVAYFEHNTPIDLKKAAELFVGNVHEYTSIFYDRNSSRYSQVVFGGYLEVEPAPQHFNTQQGE